MEEEEGRERRVLLRNRRHCAWLWVGGHHAVALLHLPHLHIQPAGKGKSGKRGWQRLLGLIRSCSCFGLEETDRRRKPENRRDAGSPKRQEEVREGHLNQAGRSSALEVVDSKAYLSQKMNSLLGVTSSQGPMWTRWETRPRDPWRRRDDSPWQSEICSKVVLSLSLYHTVFPACSGNAEGNCGKDRWA